MSILGALTPHELSLHFDGATLARARAYTRQVSPPLLSDLSGHGVSASARVQGTQHQPYLVRLEVDLEEEDRLSVASSCSCPVGYQCKHGAALALVLGSDDPAPPAGPTWERRLGALLAGLDALAAPDEERPGLGLEISLDDGLGRPYHAPHAELRIRPMRPGSRKRQAWVKSQIGWQDVAPAIQQRRHDPTKLDVLSRLRAAIGSSGSYWYAGLDPTLGDVGRMLVPLLEEAVDAGITLLPGFGLTHVSLAGAPLEVVADAVATDSATTLHVGVEHGGRLWWGPSVMHLGVPAHSVALLDAGGVVLGALRRPLTGTAVQALCSPDPVAVPASASDAVPGVLRRLARALPVRSSDDSVAMPEPLVPRLRVTVAWRSASYAALTWSVVYGQGEGERSHGLDDSAPDLLRDRAAERVLVAGALATTPVAHRVLEGPDALALALHELPVWREHPDIEVVEHDAPDFREARTAPEISFEVVERPTDWLDLEITVLVDGQALALPDVLAALTLGHEHLVLPSGLFVRADRPELAQLAEVVRAAAELAERPDDDRVRVGSHDLGLWAQLAELGVVDAQAAEWVRRARALRDLVDLPRPEPTGLASTLRHYQLDGFHWLAFLWQHRLGGILADDMGLGKTLQVLTLVQHARATGELAAPFLVVAPTSVVSAWAGEAARHTPGLRVATVTSTGSRREHDIAALATDVDVLVTSYTLLRLESEQYAALPWAGLVLDEAQQVKNHQSKAYSAVRLIEAPFRLAVTGTPFENRLLELWSLLSITTPGLYPWPEKFTQQVARPIERDGDQAALARFQRRIRPFVLRRTKELVAADLPPKQEQVLAVELSPRHRRLYDAHLARERQRVLGLAEDFDRNRVAILAALTTLRQLALDPALVDPEHDRVGSAKIDVLVEHLREIAAEGHRALVFSTFTGFLQRVRARLDQEGVTTTYLDGRTRRRAEVVEDFRSGQAAAFLISLKAGGVGLTLTEADYVFVLDPWWNPAAEAQAVDRAHRIGQHRTVMVYRMVSADTIEEKVVALKERKAALFSQVVDGEGATASGIDADDIRALFE